MMKHSYIAKRYRDMGNLEPDLNKSTHYHLMADKHKDKAIKHMSKMQSHYSEKFGPRVTPAPMMGEISNEA